MYNGKITHEEIAPKGQLAEEKKVNCTIERISGYDELNVKAKRTNALKGLFANNTPSFGGFVKKLTTRYTFLGKIKKAVNLKIMSLLLECRATLMEVARYTNVYAHAKLTNDDSKEMYAQRANFFHVKSALVAYFRSPIQYVKRVYFVRLTAAFSCEAKEVIWKKIVQIARLSTLIECISVLFTRQKRIMKTSKYAVAESAPSDIETLEYTMLDATHEAVAGAGGSVGVGIGMNFAVEHEASLATWFYPEIDGDGLIIRQAYSAVQDGYDLEVI